MIVMLSVVPRRIASSIRYLAICCLRRCRKGDAFAPGMSTGDSATRRPSPSTAGLPTPRVGERDVRRVFPRRGAPTAVHAGAASRRAMRRGRVSPQARPNSVVEQT